MPLLQRLRAAHAAWRAAGVPTPPARRVQVDETFWLEGRAHVVTAVAKGIVDAEATAVAFDAEHAGGGARRVRCLEAELVWLELQRHWVLPGREGPMVNPAKQGG